MIRTTRPPAGRALHNLVVVAFDPATGAVHGRYVHSAFGSPDHEGAGREGRRLLAELAGRRGEGASPLEVVVLAEHELAGSAVDRIDPATRRPMPRAAR